LRGRPPAIIYIREAIKSLFTTEVNTDPYGRSYAGIQISRDPGVPYLYAGFVIFSLGLVFLARNLRKADRFQQSKHPFVPWSTASESDRMRIKTETLNSKLIITNFERFNQVPQCVRKIAEGILQITCHYQ
jgi:hypothetical protein